MIHIYENEQSDIPVYTDKVTILDVMNLKSASTTFIHKLIELKDNVVVINLNGQPKRVFDIVGLDKLVRVCNDLTEAELFLNKSSQIH
jgi:hypothetical protein